MRRREECIRRYMAAWQHADEEAAVSTLSADVCITESHGPVYEGILQVRQWFRSWCRIGQVLRWDALRFWHQGDETIVKWRFCYICDGVESSFDGLSLLRFAPDGRIASTEEYQAKTEHCKPYAKPSFRF